MNLEIKNILYRCLVLVCALVSVLGFANKASAYTIPKFYAAPFYLFDSSVTVWYSCEDYYVLGPVKYWFDILPPTIFRDFGQVTMSGSTAFKSSYAPIDQWYSQLSPASSAGFCGFGAINLGVLSPGQHTIFGLLSNPLGVSGSQGVPVWGYFSKSFNVCVPNYGSPCQTSACSVSGAYIQCDGSCYRDPAETIVPPSTPVIYGPPSVLAYDLDGYEFYAVSNACLVPRDALGNIIPAEVSRSTGWGTAHITYWFYLDIENGGQWINYFGAHLSSNYGAYGGFYDASSGFTHSYRNPPGIITAFENSSPGTARVRVQPYIVIGSSVYNESSPWLTVNILPISCAVANACGRATGTLRDHRGGSGGYCDAELPPVPSNYGSSCTSAANSCGDRNYGSVQCNGSCSAGSAPAERSEWNKSCTLTSPSNVCGKTTTSTGTTNCDGQCAGTTPATPSNSTCLYTLTVNKAGNGTGSVTGGGTYTYNPTTPVSVTASA
ncbi:hypothetical protein HY415_03025, partial [Candidatus Kaiserbacteria bacterium]|nr:hypothetical protein [Candidatus Kaiserbacteria bacterium]